MDPGGAQPFKLETTVPSFEKRQSGDSETYIVYVINVTAVSAKSVRSSWCIKKRYREFYELHQLLKKTGTGDDEPRGETTSRLSFPGKSGRLSFTLKSMGTGRANSQLEKRREKLENFLAALTGRYHVSLPISTRKHLSNFLQVSQHKQGRSHLRSPSILWGSATIAKEGYLCKRSVSASLFRHKHRYFRLVGGGLAYYRTELDAQAQGYVRCAGTSRCHLEPRYHRFGFVLSGNEVQQPLYMYAETKTEADSWVNSIRLVIEEVAKVANRLQVGELASGVEGADVGQGMADKKKRTDVSKDGSRSATTAQQQEEEAVDHRKSDEREGPSGDGLDGRDSDGEVEVQVWQAGNHTQRVFMLQRKRATSCDTPKAGNAAAWQNCESIRQHRINSAGSRAATRWGSSGQVLLQGYLRKLSSSSIIGRQWRSW
jgi:hypothetical protein